jgi:hypothetical protein
VATPGVDFFRVDRSGSVRRLLVGAGVMVTLGASLIGGHLVSRLAPGLGHLITLIGGLIVISGLIFGFGAMAMILMENVYLLIRPDGLLYHENGNDTVIPWGELSAVSVEPARGVVVLERTGAESVRWFAGKSAKDVSAKVEEARRKALHGLLHPSPG